MMMVRMMNKIQMRMNLSSRPARLAASISADAWQRKVCNLQYISPVVIQFPRAEKHTSKKRKTLWILLFLRKNA